MSRVVLALACCGPLTGAHAAYDPLATPGGEPPAPLDLTAHDARRDRDLPLRVYLPPEGLPTDRAPAAVLLFSHGLGGNRETSTYLKHWAARGYAVVFLQHPGSDDTLWKGKGALRGFMAMKQAANTENFLLRVADVPAVLDALDAWNRGEGDEPGASGLRGRLDLGRVGMAGHSFGAMTTQAVSGQAVGGGPLARAAAGGGFTEPRIRAAVVMSPSVPLRGSAEQAFGKVATPWLLMTGTNDVARIGGQTVESRRGVYAALPPGSKYELVLDGAEHSAFTDRPLPGDQAQRNPAHHKAILALSTAFWDAYVRGGSGASEARAWLDGAGPRGVLGAEDIGQKK